MKTLKVKLEILLTILCLFMVYAYVNKQKTVTVEEQPAEVAATMNSQDFMELVDQAQMGKIPREAISRVQMTEHALFAQAEEQLASLN